MSIKRVTADYWKCRDCGSFNQSLMYKFEVWQKVAKQDEMLCTTCFERRLGRETTIKDLLPKSGMNDATIIMVKRIEADLRDLEDEIESNGVSLKYRQTRRRPKVRRGN